MVLGRPGALWIRLEIVRTECGLAMLSAVSLDGCPRRTQSSIATPPKQPDPVLAHRTRLPDVPSSASPRQRPGRRDAGRHGRGIGGTRVLMFLVFYWPIRGMVVGYRWGRALYQPHQEHRRQRVDRAG